MPNDIGELIYAKLQPRMNRLNALVQSVPRDANGRTIGYVVAQVAGQRGVRVECGTSEVYYPGDSLIVEQRGGAASASYVVAGFTAGMRPDAGFIEFSEALSIGNTDYSPGDLLFGAPFGPNWWFDYDQGVMYLRTGSTQNGAIRADGSLELGPPGGVHQRLTATGIEWRNGTTVLAGLDALGRTIYGFERLGQPHGPGIEWGPVTDEVTGETRFALRMLGAEGLIGFSLLTGTPSAPDDYRIIVGPDGAAQRMIYQAGNLDVTGTINAGAGTLGGWTIESDRIRGGRAYLQAAGALNLYGGTTNHWVLLDATAASYPVAVGHATASSAPFRVDWTGGVYITAIKALSGSVAPGSGAYVVDVTGTGSGANAIRGTGDTVGVYGYGNRYGLQGVTPGGTGAAGVYGQGTVNYTGVHGKGDPGVLAEAYDSSCDAFKAENGPINANSQNITNVARIYFDSTHYLYMSGSDVYWYNGATGVKLN